MNTNKVAKITEFLLGLLFGLGLILSGMTNPAKVQNFLDLNGMWDPSLALVMGGAIAVGFFAFALAKQKKQSLLGQVMDWPSETKITYRLCIGSALFGIGWGIGGFCPGPALVAMASGVKQAFIFVAAMLVGSLLCQLRDKLRSKIDNTHQ
jgi:uncharacterized membrane protein YedE/YeeE